MLTINIHVGDLFFKDITKNDLSQVLKLYNQNEINMYATGIDRTMSLEDITQKYLEVLVNSHEFFVGIFRDKNAGLAAKAAEEEYKLSNYEFIGVIKGRIDYSKSDEAWISSILIDSSLQRKGIGTYAVVSIIKLLNDTYGIRKVLIGTLSGNSIGKRFWSKLGFSYLRTIDQYMKLNSKTEDFIIMKKDLEK